ncbi:MAG: PilW family protein [Aquificaceae bacterium]
MSRGFTLIELLVATVLSLFVALSLSYVINVSLKTLDLYRKKVQEKKVDQFVYTVQRQLIGCHSLDFRDGMSYLTSFGLTEEFVRVHLDAGKDGVLYEEYDPWDGILLYRYTLPVDSIFSYDGRKSIRFRIGRREYVLLIFCSEEYFIKIRS